VQPKTKINSTIVIPQEVRLTDTPFVEARQLFNELQQSNIVLIDTRDDQAFNKGHLPGAVQIHDIFTYISLPENGGLPALFDHFSILFAYHGIRQDDEIVIYEDTTDNGYGQSCRGWMILNYLGYNKIRVLHGGFRAWAAAGLEVSQAVVVRPQLVLTHTKQEGVFVNAADMLAALEEPDIALLDCRDYAEWIGANSSPYGFDYCPRKGRIPKAVWLEWYRFMRHDKGISWFEHPETINRLCESAGLRKDQTIYVYCFKGARASSVVLAMKTAGYKDVRNYFNSWNEWSRNLDLPIEEGYPE
jgi:thiosulfate/3-mercaptopyruvate sulfurtransferase